jgi:iron complex outermembrane receptor protein
MSLGADYESKTMTETQFGVFSEATINTYPHPSSPNYFSEATFDSTNIQINQIIQQKSLGVFFIDKLDIMKKLYATLNVRYDYVYNKLINNIPVPDSMQQSGNRAFSNTSARFGLVYDAAKFLNLYASYGTGFLVPTEDELYNNPVTYGGFNETIKPSTYMGGELGVRGDISRKLYYDVTGYYIDTKNEFSRYSIPERGNNTAFFRNTGSSTRYGIEAYVSYVPTNFLKFDVAYTWLHAQYTSAADSNKGHWIPQCPQHVLMAEGSVKFLKHFTVELNVQYESKWYIQVDDSIYNQYTDIVNGVSIKRNSWVPGFTTIGANLSYQFNLGSVKSELSLFGKNLFDEHYFGFTEPNNGPEYNSYQPAPGREFFLSLKLRF